MMALLEYIGRESGIDRTVRSAAGLEQAQAERIVAVARFLAAVNGQAVTDMESFQLSHDLPFRKPLRNRDCTALLDWLSSSWETDLPRQFMRLRRAFAPAGGGRMLACELAGTPCDPGRQGFRDREPDGPPFVRRRLIVYSGRHGEPVACAEESGIREHAADIRDALQKAGLSAEQVETFTEEPLGSEEELCAFLGAGIGFTALCPTDAAPARAALKEGGEEALGLLSNMSPSDAGLAGACLERAIPLPGAERAAGGRKRQAQNCGRVFLSLTKDLRLASESEADFRTDLHALRQKLERGGSLSGRERELAGSCLLTEKRDGRLRVTFNDAAAREEIGRFGLLALVSDRADDAFDVLQAWTRCERTRTFFRNAERAVARMQEGVAQPNTGEGALFVCLVAHCYADWLETRAARIMDGLRADPEDSTSEGEDASPGKDLLAWLEGCAAGDILHHFDTLERSRGAENRFAQER
ncbi:MAG: hypothetical protein Q4F72_11540, partial [Desulfovibrionaceae bacterium]|nr:hypothetical protein [Desulfovibrionaceae bacterium]